MKEQYRDLYWKFGRNVVYYRKNLRLTGGIRRKLSLTFPRFRAILYEPHTMGF